MDKGYSRTGYGIVFLRKFVFEMMCTRVKQTKWFWGGNTVSVL